MSRRELPVNALRRAVHATAVVAVLVVLGVATAAAVVRVNHGTETSQEHASSQRSSGPEPGANTSDPPSVSPFIEPPGGWVMTNWAIQSAREASYRMPPGWRAGTAAVVYEDADGALLARGTTPAYYYGNDCVDGATEVPAAWAVLADPVEGDDLSATAEAAVLAWSRGFARNAAGTTAPISEPVTEPVLLADGTGAVRSWVTVDMTVFSGPCLPQQAQVAATTVAGARGRLHTLVQSRYLVDSGGVSTNTWSTLAASLRAE